MKTISRLLYRIARWVEDWTEREYDPYD